MLDSGADARLVVWLNGHALHHSGYAEVAIFCASSLPDAMIALLILFVLIRPNRSIQLLVLVAVAMVSAWLLAQGVKSLGLRPRPFESGLVQALIPHSGGSSFPSTHASVAFAVAWLGTILRVDRRLLGLWWAGSLAVVAGRVACGLHYPSDLIGGLVIGLVCAVVAAGTARRMAGAVPIRAP